MERTIKITLTKQDRFFYQVMASKVLTQGGRIKEIECELQAIIEKIWGSPWYENTDRNIFVDLLNLDKTPLDEYIFKTLLPSLKNYWI